VSKQPYPVIAFKGLKTVSGFVPNIRLRLRQLPHCKHVDGKWLSLLCELLSVQISPLLYWFC